MNGQRHDTEMAQWCEEEKDVETDTAVYRNNESQNWFGNNKMAAFPLRTLGKTAILIVTHSEATPNEEVLVTRVKLGQDEITVTGKPLNDASMWPVVLESSSGVRI